MQLRELKKCLTTTVINWVKKFVIACQTHPVNDEIPEITQIDELETFVGKKKQNLVVDSSK